MANITVTSTPTPLVGANTDAQLNRVVYISNLSTNNIWLLFDGSNQANLSSSTPVGYQLAAGAGQRFGGQSNGDNDGTMPIWAVSVGSALVNVQIITGRRTRP